jgi:hypothetical protein
LYFHEITHLSLAVMSDSVQHLDIQSEKLIDWLTSRGQLQGDWLTQLKSVQSKVKSTLANPAAYSLPIDIQRTMEESGANFWACQDGLDQLSTTILKERGLQPSESGKLKNFFGSYSDPPLKALAALIALYRKNNLFLAESARLMTQAVSYDIPQLKALVKTNTKQNEDLVRKMAEESKAARDLRAKQTQQLRENWRLSSLNDLERQLKKRAEDDVPELINAVIKSTKEAKFGEAMEYYREFVKYSLQDDAAKKSSTAAAAAAAASATMFPTLTSVRESDLLPERSSSSLLSEPTVTSVESTSSISSGGIEWDISVEGAGESASAGGATINWDITSEPVAATAASSGSGGIDWGEDGTVEAAPAEINWDIEVAEAGSAASPAASPALSASTSTSATSFSSLESDSVRHSFLTELLDLESFLISRTAEQTTSDDLSAAAFSGKGVPHILALQSLQTSQGYLTSVRAVLDAFRAPRLTQLLLIRTSKRYLERIVSGIRQQSASIDRLERAAVEHEARRAELSRVTSRSSHELKQIVARTKDIKKRAEAEISKLFQNRPVHIVGEINQMLQ